jgi:hypothetical protein
MARQDWRNRGRLSPCAVGGLVLACALTGCRTPPARFAGCDPGPHTPSRIAALIHQQGEDTAVEATHRPLQTGHALLAESGQLLREAGQELALKRLDFSQPPCPPAGAKPPLDPAALEAALRQVSCTPLQPADIRLYPDGAEALAALEQLIDSASCRIDVLMFIWDNDPLGWAVAQRLAARAGPDLPVRVLVDGGGNLIFGQPDEAPTAEVNRIVCWLARQPHVEVLRTRNGFLRFDHRKLVLVDGRAAWTGGAELHGGGVLPAARPVVDHRRPAGGRAGRDL